MTGSERFFDDFKKIIFRHVFDNFQFFENVKELIKSDVSDANGPRKHDFHKESIPIDTGETNFRSTVTHFIICFAILTIFVTKPSTPLCLS